jgi:hypothetical protein
VSNDFVAENTASLARLRALVERLSDADLSRPTGNGWTIAEDLAHLAFWDRRAVAFIENPERLKAVTAMTSAEVDSLNDAAHALCAAIPPRAAAQLAVTSAEAADRAVAALTPDGLAQVEAAGMPFNLSRADHRLEHVEQIERLLEG